MEITPKNQQTIPATDPIIRNKGRKLPKSITPEENSQKTFIKLHIKTVEQQCDVKAKVLSHWWYTEYADDIIDELRRSEASRPAFLKQSPQIAYRDYCVNFMREVAESELLSRTTFHLAIYYLDIFMDRHRIAVDRLSLVVLCCLGIASKLEDRDQDVPKYSDLNGQMNNVYCISDYQKLERMIIQSFQYCLIYPTAAVFIEYYMEASVSESDYQKSDKQYNCCADLKAAVAGRILEILDLTINDYEMVQMLPSKLSAAVLAAGRKLVNIENVWTTELALLTNYLFKDIEQLMQALIKCHSELAESSSSTTMSNSE
ncbi:hypothetical protein HA402_013529 [Bradysia odoriphaga]|nr:hypothetical protein HA402_013529 [Bradysia odoriphaga]